MTFLKQDHIQIWVNLCESHCLQVPLLQTRRISNQINMSANKVGFVPNLTFVSITGPTLDNISGKAMRAHTTRANFTRRRLRLVREYADQKECAARVELLQVEEDDQTTDRNQVVDIQRPIFSHPGLDRKLNGKDVFLINHCA